MRNEKRDTITVAFHHACLTNQSFNESLESILKVCDKNNSKNKSKNSMKINYSSGTNGMHNPSSVTAVLLTRDHNMAIGTPRGKIS